MTTAGCASLVAVSDLHVDVPENRAVLAQLRPGSGADWLIVAGDVGETMAEIERALTELADRFSKVIWVPGNHDLWTTPDDDCQLRGAERYMHIVRSCRRLGIVTPEDPFPVWDGAGGPVLIAPLFLLYDYSFGRRRRDTNGSPLPARAREAGVVCSDEFVLSPEPYQSVGDWCRSRVSSTRARLDAATRDGTRTVLVNHWPLLRELTRPLLFPDFAQWCGTEATADWHLRFNAQAVVFGHLHIPRTTVHDGVRFLEVSLGYPREWRRRSSRPPTASRVLPE